MGVEAQQPPTAGEAELWVVVVAAHVPGPVGRGGVDQIRIERHPHVDPPPALADAPSAVVRDWRRAVIRAIGDGETVTPKTAAELAAAHTRQEINA